MIPLTIILDGDNAWPDLKDKPADKLHHVTAGMAVAMLDGGMTSGLPSVAFRIDLADGSTVIAETSARLFVTAARAFEARHGSLFGEATVQ
jgi:hypothetical protein